MNLRKLEHEFRRIGARIPPILYPEGMRILMFQLSGFYYRVSRFKVIQNPIHTGIDGRVWLGLKVWGLFGDSR